MVSFMIFTASVQNILDTTMYAHIFAIMNIKHVITVPNYLPWQGQHRENEADFQKITQITSYLQI
jgi:hypothetical protein